MGYSLLRSRTFWVLVITFIVGGGNAIMPMLPAGYEVPLLAILGGLASYYHLQTGNSTTGSN